MAAPKKPTPPPAKSHKTPAIKKGKTSIGAPPPSSGYPSASPSPAAPPAGAP